MNDRRPMRCTVRTAGLVAWPVLVVLMGALLLGSCGGGGGGGSDGGAEPLSASVSPASPHVMSPTDPVVIRFNRAMDPGTLTDSGVLKGQSNPAQWSSASLTDDTLTYQPASTWTSGPGLTLTIDVSDAGGEALPTLTLEFHAVDGIIYVRTAANGGNDGNPGTADQPKATVPAAITAAGVYTTAAVFVAAGSYDAGMEVAMQDAVSLFGGFGATSWATRNPATHITTLAYATAPAGALPATPSTVVRASGGVTSATVLDGFAIDGAGSANSAAVFMDTGSLTVRNSTLSGGAGTGTATAIYVNTPGGAPPLIAGNTLDGGTGTTATYGLRNEAASPTVRDNVIHGGAGATSRGIHNTGGSPAIDANTIDGGTGDVRLGIESVSASSPTITGNTIDLTGTASATANYGISCQGAGTAPDIQGNTIHAGSSSGSTVGIQCSSGTSPSITNGNVIDGGTVTGTTSQGVGLSSVTTGTVTGNTIYGGAGATSATGLGITGPVNVSDNQIRTGDSAGNNIALSISGATSTGTVARNWIQGGTAGSTAWGANLSNGAAPDLHNNVILAASSTGISMGVQTDSAAPILRNNTILGGDSSGSLSYGIRLFGTSAGATIQNNIIGSGTGTSTYCVGEWVAGTDPGAFDNNDLVPGCDVLYQDEGSGGTAITTISGVNALADVGASGNVSDDPAFADPAAEDYHLTAGSTTAVQTGGLDGNGLGWGFADDYDQTGRSVGWSMGAFEY